MKFGIFGGATRWSKILIKNFKKKNCKLFFTSSFYLKSKKNFKNLKKIPKGVHFIIIASDPFKNLRRFNLFKHSIIFCEKPILPSYKYFDKIYRRGKNFIFCNYQHIYSEPLIFIKKKLINKKNCFIQIRFGKNGKPKRVLPSYEWLPHPLSIIYYLGFNLNEAMIFSKDYKNQFKQNFLIKNKNISILSGNNFKKKEYSIKITYGKNICYYDAKNPLECRVNNKTVYFNKFPLESSIDKFLLCVSDYKNYKKEIKLNTLISKKIMYFFKKYKL